MEIGKRGEEDGVKRLIAREDKNCLATTENSDRGSGLTRYKAVDRTSNDLWRPSETGSGSFFSQRRWIFKRNNGVNVSLANDFTYEIVGHRTIAVRGEEGGGGEKK